MEETLHGAEDICQQLIIGSYFVLSSLIEYISNCKGRRKMAEEEAYPNIDELTERSHIVCLR